MNETKNGDYIRWWYVDEDNSTKSNAGTIQQILGRNTYAVDTIDGKKDVWLYSKKIVNYGRKI
jgi:hypothetical protein